MTSQQILKDAKEKMQIRRLAGRKLIADLKAKKAKRHSSLQEKKQWKSGI